MHPLNISFFSLVIFFLISFASAADRCHPQEKTVIEQLYNRTINFDCCYRKHVTCDARTNWIVSISISDNDALETNLPVVSKLTHLVWLQIKESRNLVGEIPPAISKLTKLTFLRIAYNNFTGPVPAWISKLTELETLDLSYNKLTGPIPDFLFDLPKLTKLRLDRNQLTGPIPPSFSRYRGTELYLGLNQLSGAVPPSLSRIDFTRIELQRNRLTGDPSHLFNNRDKSLSYLDLSRNLFEFDLSNVVFPVKSLTHVDLNHNRIRGSIPKQVVDVAGLTTFNVSYNRLCGKIPQGGALQQIESYSFLHNACLCGPPLSNPC